MKHFTILEQLAIINRCATMLELLNCKELLQETQNIHDRILQLFNEKMDSMLIANKIA